MWNGWQLCLFILSKGKLKRWVLYVFCMFYVKENNFGMCLDFLFCFAKTFILFCYVVWNFKNTVWKLSENKGLEGFVLPVKLSHVVTQAGRTGEGRLQNVRFHAKQTCWVTYMGQPFACSGPGWQKKYFIACETAFQVCFRYSSYLAILF